MCFWHNQIFAIAKKQVVNHFYTKSIISPMRKKTSTKSIISPMRKRTKTKIFLHLRISQHEEMPLSRLCKKCFCIIFSHMQSIWPYFFRKRKKRKKTDVYVFRTWKRKKTSSVSFSASAKFSHFRIFSHAKKKEVA